MMDNIEKKIDICGKIVGLFFIVLICCIIFLIFRAALKNSEEEKEKYKQFNSVLIGKLTYTTDIEIIQIDGHEYIFVNSDRGKAICHKQNCKYCVK